MSASPPPAQFSDVVIRGHETAILRDLYHAVLQARWPVVLGGIAAVFLAINAGFALIYLQVGGIAHARAGSFADAFFFSVQTMGTIGYGAMYPDNRAANLVVVVQAVVSLVLTALATGLVFAKFSRSAARIMFTNELVIAPMNGVPTLMLRMSNQRGNFVVEAQIRIALTRTERMAEGTTFYRMYDLVLARDRSPMFARSWTVLHPIDDKSPLAGATPESLVKDEVEIVVTVMGIDETSMQPVHARKRYETHQILFGRRHHDILSELPDGRLLLDLTKFHHTVPSARIPGFPYGE